MEGRKMSQVSGIGGWDTGGRKAFSRSGHRGRKRSFARLKRAKLHALLQENPLDRQSLEELGILLFESCEFEEAVEVLLTAVEHGSKSPTVFATLGCCYYDLNQLDDATLAFREAQSLSSAQNGALDLGVYAYFVRSLVLSEANADANEICAMLLKQYKNKNPVEEVGSRFGGFGAFCVFASSVSAHLLYDFEQSLKFLETAHKQTDASLAPYTPLDVWLLVSRVYGLCGKPKFESLALQKNCPKDLSQTWAKLAHKHELQHDFHGALDCIEQGLIREPFHPGYLRAKARCVFYTDPEQRDQVYEIRKFANESETLGCERNYYGVEEQEGFLESTSKNVRRFIQTIFENPGRLDQKKKHKQLKPISREEEETKQGNGDGKPKTPSRRKSKGKSDINRRLSRTRANPYNDGRLNRPRSASRRKSKTNNNKSTKKTKGEEAPTKQQDATSDKKQKQTRMRDSSSETAKTEPKKQSTNPGVIIVPSVSSLDTESPNGGGMCSDPTTKTATVDASKNQYTDNMGPDPVSSSFAMQQTFFSSSMPINHVHLVEKLSPQSPKAQTYRSSPKSPRMSRFSRDSIDIIQPVRLEFAEYEENQPEMHHFHELIASPEQPHGSELPLHFERTEPEPALVAEEKREVVADMVNPVHKIDFQKQHSIPLTAETMGDEAIPSTTEQQEDDQQQQQQDQKEEEEEAVLDDEAMEDQLAELKVPDPFKSRKTTRHHDRSSQFKGQSTKTMIANANALLQQIEQRQKQTESPIQEDEDEEEDEEQDVEVPMEHIEKSISDAQALLDSIREDDQVDDSSFLSASEDSEFSAYAADDWHSDDDSTSNKQQ